MGLLFKSVFFIKTWQGLEDEEEHRQAILGMKQILDAGVGHSLDPIRHNSDRVLQVFSQFPYPEKRLLYSLVFSLQVENTELKETHVFDALFGQEEEDASDTAVQTLNADFRYLALGVWLGGSLMVHPPSRTLDWSSNGTYLAKCFWFDSSLDGFEVALFASLGVYLLVATSFLIRDPYSLPFLMLSMLFGMYSLQIYLIFFFREGCVTGNAGLERQSPFVLAQLMLSLFVVWYGFQHGTGVGFLTALKNNPIVLIISCQFVAFWLAGYDWVRMDLRKRQLQNNTWLLMACVPLLGPTCYLSLTSLLDAPILKGNKRD